MQDRITIAGHRRLARLAAGIVLCLAGTQVHAADAVTVLFDWLPSGAYAPWYYGVQAGCFRDVNLDVTLKRGFGGADSVTKVAAGAAEFGIADLGTVMLARIRSSAAVRAVMPIYKSSPLTVATLAGGPVKTLKDLEGRKLGAASGDSAVLILPIAMQAAGADMAKVTKVSVEPTGIAGFLIQGKVDAVTTYVTSAIGIDIAARGVGKHVETIDFGKSLAIYGNALVASDKLLAQKPDFAKRFVAGATCAFAKAEAAPAEALGALTAAVPELPPDGQRALLDTALSLTQGPAGWDMARVQKTLEVTLAAQEAKTDLSASTFVASP